MQPDKLDFTRPSMAMEEVKNDPNLTKEEKDKRIIELAAQLGKAFFEELAKRRSHGK